MRVDYCDRCGSTDDVTYSPVEGSRGYNQLCKPCRTEIYTWYDSWLKEKSVKPVKPNPLLKILGITPR